MQLTGYTSFIVDKHVNAVDYLKICLRAFGVLIHLRDAPLNADIPKELQKDDYHEKSLAYAEEQLAKRLAMTDAEWRKTIENDLALTIAQHKEAVDKENSQMASLNAVKKVIEGWKCGEAYECVKKFALEQIAESKPAGDKWYVEVEESLKKALDSQDAFEEYKERRIKSARDDIAYYKERAEKSEAEWKKANEFLAGFWKELEQLENECK